MNTEEERQKLQKLINEIKSRMQSVKSGKMQLLNFDEYANSKSCERRKI